MKNPEYMTAEEYNEEFNVPILSLKHKSGVSLKLSFVVDVIARQLTGISKCEKCLGHGCVKLAYGFGLDGDEDHTSECLSCNGRGYIGHSIKDSNPIIPLDLLKHLQKTCNEWVDQKWPKKE